MGDADFLKTLDPAERERLAALVADSFATQVLTDGFYHADPHSGNVLVNDPEPVGDASGEGTDAAGEDGAPQVPEH